MCVIVYWSPKGKQLVIGCEDGSLKQFDPDLNEKRRWDTPSILTAGARGAGLHTTNMKI